MNIRIEDRHMVHHPSNELRSVKRGHTSGLSFTQGMRFVQTSTSVMQTFREVTVGALHSPFLSQGNTSFGVLQTNLTTRNDGGRGVAVVSPFIQQIPFPSPTSSTPLPTHDRPSRMRPVCHHKCSHMLFSGIHLFLFQGLLLFRGPLVTVLNGGKGTALGRNPQKPRLLLTDDLNGLFHPLARAKVVSVPNRATLGSESLFQSFGGQE